MSQTKAQLLDNIKDNVQLDAQKALRFADSDSSHYVAFRAPGTVSSSVTWTLPAADGSANYVLATDGSGNLSWIADPAGQWVTSGSNIYFTGGNVGIGDSSPSNPLSVTGASAFNGDVQFTGASYNVTWDKSVDDLIFNDNAKACFGTGSDLQIYHDGSHSQVKDAGSGGLHFWSGDYRFYNAAGSEYLLRATENGEVQIYHDNGEKLNTVTDGINLTGSLQFGDDTDTHLSRPAANKLAITTGGTERVRFDSTGRVGIGVTSPSRTLDIQSASNENGFSLNCIGTPANYFFDIRDDGSVVYRLDANNRVLIGTDTEGEASADNLTIADGQHAGLTIRSGTSSYGSIFFSDGTSGNDEYEGAIEYDHANDFLQLRTAATARFKIDSSGSVEVNPGNTTSNGLLIIGKDGSGEAQLRFSSASNNTASIRLNSSEELAVFYGSSEHVRFDSSGRVLVGHTASRAVGGGEAVLQVQKATSEAAHFIRTSNDAGAPIVALAKSRSSAGAVCQAGDKIGVLGWYPHDGTDCNHASAEIHAEVVAGIGSNDVPGDLVFKTNSGTTTTTERLRITSVGNVGIGGLANPTASAYDGACIHIHQTDTATTGSQIHLTNTDTGSAAGNGAHISMWADDDLYITNQESDGQIKFASGGNADALVINDSGVTVISKLGIGESDVSGFGGTYKGVDVAYQGTGISGRTDNPTLDIRSNIFYDGSNWKYGQGSTTAGLLNVGGNQLIFYAVASGTAGATATLNRKLTIDSSGNLLHKASGAGSSTDPGFKIIDWVDGATNRGSTIYHVVNNDSASNTFHYCYNTNATNNGHRFSVKINGGINNHSGNNSNLSDRREKKDIEDLPSTWNAIKQWGVKKFHFNDVASDATENDKNYGVIAQEIELISPEVGTEWIKQEEEKDKDGKVTKEKITRKGIRESKIMWMAIKALQEAQTKIETLETKVAALESA